MARILLAEDNEQSRYMLETLLKGHGHDVVTAANGAEALTQARARPPDLIVSDILMPGMDGFEVAELTRQRKDTQTIPIIFVTAISKEKKYVFKGYQAGAVDYLFKPLDPLILKSKVDFFLSLDKQRRELQQKLREAQAHRAAYEAGKSQRGEGSGNPS